MIASATRPLPPYLMMLFTDEAYVEDSGALANVTENERGEWFVRHDNY
ncbi:hypothetical protein ABFA25_05600 [Mycobacterium lepromatosis]